MRTQQNKFFLIVLFHFLKFNTFSQNQIDLKDMQGIWMTRNLSDEENENEKSYLVIKNDTAMILTYTESKKKAGVLFIKCGFQNKLKKDIDSLSLKDLKIKGAYFTEVFVSNIKKNNYAKKSAIVVFEYIELSENTLEMNAGKLSSFTKVNNLPQHITESLNNLALSSKVNYLKYLLVSGNYKVVVPPKVNIFLNTNTPTKMYLLKNDEVEILEEKGEWLKVRYYGKKTIEGWIKKSDV